jgi:hypothetical protein
MKKTPEGQDRPPGMIVVFATMDELRLWAPVALREWLKRNRPVGRQLRSTGVLVEFDRWPHAAVAGSESVSAGGGS